MKMLKIISQLRENGRILFLNGILTLEIAEQSFRNLFLIKFFNKIYKLMKKTLPGPYTYILNANSSIPKLFKNSKIVPAM